MVVSSLCQLHLLSSFSNTTTRRDHHKECGRNITVQYAVLTQYSSREQHSTERVLDIVCAYPFGDDITNASTHVQSVKSSAIILSVFDRITTLFLAAKVK